MRHSSFPVSGSYAQIHCAPGTTICGLADGAAWPMKNAIRKFRDEFEQYIKTTNPDGYLETDPVPALEVIGVH